VLRSAGLDAREYADRLETRPAVDAGPLPAVADAPRAWAVESCRLVVDAGLYPRGHVVRDDYLDTHRPLAERRVLQAAFRLAALIEDALAPR
jgi:nuclease S1